MCGRYTLAASPEAVAEHFGLDVLPLMLVPHYNIAPGQSVAIVREVEGLGRHLDFVRWGLVPVWAESRRVGYSLFNARAETLDSKPAFRQALRRRRCLIPADGFYEWHAGGNGKQPYWFGREDHGLFAFAGLWEHWDDPISGTALESCTLITTTANATAASVYERMPAILPPADYPRWLDPALDEPARLLPLLRPCPDELLIHHPVSRDLNSPRKDNPHLIRPLRLTTTRE